MLGNRVKVLRTIVDSNWRDGHWCPLFGRYCHPVFRKGQTLIFGISGAALALIGCVLGDLIFYSGIIAREQGASFLEIFFLLLVTPAAAIEVFTLAFSFMDFFYALAAYAGFSASMDIKCNRH